MDGKVLIVDDLATNRIVYKVRLGAAFYQPLLAADGMSCLRAAREAAPDIILLDLVLPDLPGAEVLARLRADPATADIPVVALTASRDPAARMQALAAGADEVLVKPVDELLLLARMRNLLRGRAAAGLPGGTARLRLETMALQEPAAGFIRPGHLALVAERTETALRWRRDLQACGRERITILPRANLLAELGDEAGEGGLPDLFVVEADPALPGDEGMRLMSDLRSRGATRNAAVCLVAPRLGDEVAAMAFDLGADDVVDAGIGAEEWGLRLGALLRRKREADRLRASVQSGLRMAMVDPLTGLNNRRYALPRLRAMYDAAQREGAGLAVMVVDIDRFKAVNDRHGHAAGDAVLVEVARRLSLALGPEDLLARIGGEEFLVALAGADQAQARLVAERLCLGIEAAPVALPSGQKLRVSASIGVALAPAAAADGTDAAVAALIDAADHALLRAKAEGRNRVTFTGSAAA
jgi:two-component system cell cycle response regulator